MWYSITFREPTDEGQEFEKNIHSINSSGNTESTFLYNFMSSKTSVSL